MCPARVLDDSNTYPEGCTAKMRESSAEFKDVSCSSAECGASTLRRFSRSSLLQHRNSYVLSAFCTEDNVHECLSHINQEVSSFGLPPVLTELTGSSELSVVSMLNSMYDLIQLHRRGLRTLESMEVEQLKSNSNVDFLQLTTTRLKDQLENCKRENTALQERERQLQLKVKSLQAYLKNEKEEVQKLQNIIASRASQYNHEMKRKEREFNKLKERLNQLLVDKKDKKQAIDVLNYIGRADRKRSLWKTGKTEAKHEGEMYKTLLNDYDHQQRELVLENAELRKLLQHMKKDMMSILRSRKSALKGDEHKDDTLQADSEEEEDVFDSAKESVELSCVHARQKLTNSIRLQWRCLKSHVERLDSQVSLEQVGEHTNIDPSPQATHQDEMDRLKLEIQRCKDFIQTQQQLLLQQVSLPCDEETASLLNNCYMQQEKERLREEWKTLEEKRNVFERERRNFTEAAIRLSHERKAFEEDRATWLKHQFLNLTPFVDTKKPLMSKSKSAFSLSETEASAALGPEKLITNQSDMTAYSSTPRCAALLSPTMSDLHHAIPLVSENRSIKSKANMPCVGELSILYNDDAQNTGTKGKMTAASCSLEK